MLHKLSDELLRKIVQRLSARTKDLIRLCRVSRRISGLVIPVLYQSVTFKAWNEDRLAALNAPPKLATALEKRYFRHTQHIRVAAPFYDRFCDRCFHRDEWTSDRDKKALDDELRAILESCRDAKLKSFHWDLGICVPWPLMLCLGAEHKHIQSLRLIIDGDCGYHECDWGVCTVEPWFPNLKRLSLGGFTFDGNRQPSTDHEFRLSIPWQALFKILNQVSHQLAEPDIDLEHAVQNPRCIFHYPMFSTWLEMLQSRPPAYKPRPSNIPVFFPALGSLSLSFVDLAGNDATIHGRPGILDAFNFSAIKQLKLRCCPGWELLLQYLTQNLNRPKYEYWDRDEKKMLQQPPFDPYNPKYTPLKSLEISYSQYPEASTNSGCGRLEILRDFLKSFKGLEKLFIVVPVLCIDLGFCCALTHHHQTLRRLVYSCSHKRLPSDDDGCVDDDGDKPEGNGHDYTLSAGSTPEKPSGKERDNKSTNPPPMFIDCLGHPLGHLPRLESLGVCFENPKFTRKLLQPLAGSASGLKLLHLRRCGPGFRTNDNLRSNRHYSIFRVPCRAHRRFLNWIFGPEGIPTIRVVVYGDWSYEQRFADYNWCAFRTEEDRAFEVPLWCEDEDYVPHGYVLCRPIQGFNRIYMSERTYCTGLVPVDWPPRVSELIREHEDLITACPVDSLFSRSRPRSPCQKDGQDMAESFAPTSDTDDCYSE